ncbi:MAG: UDP-N-acetylglucosamine--N-acetylmuramyl-(pentapeptide) pyrophosphoryl-undecaprenol N-acetylglucosamine transferase [Chlamydiia bacterium]|nr:UDP-N-acetylglucosamine--N-acetylmuramyl-(pentapeptide) pyrophosphoryl-undecaprenol N-acetylglucosamine transferase [Chlamydiia bacterium]
MARVLIASGGTGGHLFPSLVLASQLKKEGIEVLVAGAKLKNSSFFGQDELPFQEVTSRPGFKGLPYVGKGTYESLKLINCFKPDLVVGFGSFTSFPLLLAAKLKKVPLVLWAADAYPGKVIRWFSPYAKLTAVHYPEAAKHIKGATLLGEMPLRENFQKEGLQKKEALAYFGLSEDHPVLLIVGGSQGAKFLNEIAPKALKRLPAGIQIVHIAGSQGAAENLKAVYQKEGKKAQVKPFEEKMHYAWLVADIALTRAGAVSLREQLVFEVPGVVVPFPSSADNHQEENAKAMLHSGLIEMLTEARIDPDKLSKMLMSVLLSGNLRREKARRFKEKHPSKTLLEIVREFIHEAS